MYITSIKAYFRHGIKQKAFFSSHNWDLGIVRNNKLSIKNHNCKT